MTEPRRRRPSEMLDEKVALFSPALRRAREQLWSHPRLPELIPPLLFRMHWEARATEHLLRAAAAKLEADADPLAERLVPYLERLAREERGHEGWVDQGLEHLGHSLDRVHDGAPPASIAASVGAQYYWIHHHHPAIVLGYIKVVENTPATDHQIDVAARTSGLPRETFRYHINHVELERFHNRALDEILDTAPLSDELLGKIGANAARTVMFLAENLLEVIRILESQGPLDRGAREAALF